MELFAESHRCNTLSLRRALISPLFLQHMLRSSGTDCKLGQGNPAGPGWVKGEGQDLKGATAI